MLKSFDFLGDRITLLYKYEQNLKSTLGGIFSFLVFVIVFLLIIGFGQDFFLRKNPLFLKSNISLDKVPLYTVNNKNFTVAVRLETSETDNFFHRPELFQIQFMYSHYVLNISNNEWITLRKEYLEVAKCNKSLLFDDGSFADSYDIQNLWCPVLNNITLGGGWDQDEAAYLEIRVAICIDGNEGIDSNIKCGTSEQKYEALDGGVFFTYYLQKTNVNPSIRENGLLNTISYGYFGLNPYLFKFNELKFAESIMETDSGWLLKDTSTKSSIGIKEKDLQIDYFPNIIEGGYYSALAAIGFNFDKEIDKYYREYPKAQTLAAQVGGILKFFIFSGSIVVSKFNLISTQLSLFNFFFKNKYEDDIIDLNKFEKNEFNKSSVIYNNLNIKGLDGFCHNTNFNEKTNLAQDNMLKSIKFVNKNTKQLSNTSLVKHINNTNNNNQLIEEKYNKSNILLHVQKEERQDRLNNEDKEKYTNDGSKVNNDFLTNVSS